MALLVAAAWNGLGWDTEEQQAGDTGRGGALGRRALEVGTQSSL